MPTNKPKDRLAQCMKHPVTVDVSASSADAARLMESKSAGCLLATDHGRIAGIVTAGDIVRKVLASAADPEALEVRQIMTDRVVCCQPDTSPRQAQRLMEECNVPFLPVIADGKARGIVTAADVLKLQLGSARTRISRALRKARTDSKITGRILSGIDKIRTPLSSAISAAGMAMASAVDQDHKDSLAAMQSASAPLLSMIEGLLDLSDIAKGKTKLRQENFEFRQAITSTIQQMGAKAEEKGLALSCSVMPDVPERVIGDADRLRQLLGNIIDNAIKFTNSGRVDVNIETDQWTANEIFLHFSVADTGCGIPMQKQRQIFNTQRLNPTDEHTDSGGLGLAISAELVKKMHGQISVNSQPAHGSRFDFTVRLKLQSQTKSWTYSNKAALGAEY